MNKHERTINKFRGLRTDGKGWAYGDLWRKPIRFGSECYIYVADGDEEEDDTGWVGVYHHTVGQFLGLSDKNGKDVYTGDKVNFRGRAGRSNPHILFYTKSGILKIENAYGHFHIVESELYSDNVEVIGNIHEKI